MSQAVTKIKSRIKSVSGAYKVTSAMKLVSTVKLKQWRNKMIAHKEYTSEIDDIVDLLFSYCNSNSSPFFQINKANKKLYLVISSTLGLCGSYNNNIFKVSDAEITEEDDAIILGGKGITHYKNGDFTSIEGFEEYSSVEDKELVEKISKYILNEYVKGTYSEIHIIYSEYKNSLVFLARDYQLLPLTNNAKERKGYPPLMEPDSKTLVEQIVPFYLRSVIYSKLLESAVCEQGARSNAMENATNNAKELLDGLKIEFNKARQAAITQEIIEIVAAAKAI